MFITQTLEGFGRTAIFLLKQLIKVGHIFVTHGVGNFRHIRLLLPQHPGRGDRATE